VNNKYNICLFSGGRGASTILSALINVEEIHLTVLLNAYDDGLSTGYLRKLFPGMLGPSDVRKTFSTVLKSSKKNGNLLLADLLEYRIGESDSLGNVWNPMLPGGNELNLWHGRTFLAQYFENLPSRLSSALISWSDSALHYIHESIGEHQIQKSLKDIAFGNILFAGAYLENGSNFNAAIDMWNHHFSTGVSILNITQGENRVLVGLKDSGAILANEAEIVSKHLVLGKIERVYLLEKYLHQAEIEILEKGTLNDARKYLANKELLPKLSNKASEALEAAHMIVYGPGTQHSSLLPSYLTKDLAKTVATNIDAEKVFISNIGLDHDIVGENHGSLMQKLITYMNIGADENNAYEESQLITRSIVDTFGDLNFDMSKFDNSKDLSHEISFAKWGSDNYSHDGVRVSRALLTIASMNSELFEQQTLSSISIVIPVLDEIKTLPRVLNDVITFDWLGEGFVPQIIVIDGGSSDGSWSYLKQVNGILALQNLKPLGRGSAIRTGITVAKGEVVVTFPADGEYLVGAILDVAKALSDRESGIVFGSRSTLCIDTDVRLREIYGGRSREYFLSKWGGFLLSSVSAIKYRRWLSDPLTSIKGFKGLESMKLSLTGDSLDWDTQIIVDSWLRSIPIMEIAVEYSPRTQMQGKKTTIYSGFKSLWQLLTPVK
jgi:2-phospho-L-lactate transferase/gluconeogenesis factor (CofD/UPF0052 family)